MKVSNRVLIGYHADCIDGYTSAWVAHIALCEEGYDVELIGLHYGQEEEEINGCGLYAYSKLCIVDFSLTPAYLVNLSDAYPSLKVTILDHHKKAYDMYEEAKDRGIRIPSNVLIKMDLEECGASLTWKHFNPLSVRLPYLIAAVKSWDLWKFDVPNTKAINAYLRQQSKTIANWSSLWAALDDEVKLREITAEGYAILVREDAEVDVIVKQAKPVKLGGIIGLGVAAPYKYASTIGNILAVRCGTFGVTWCRTQPPESQGFIYSIRADKSTDVDVNNIAKLYGGGGHVKAAGFKQYETAEDWLYLGDK